MGNKIAISGLRRKRAQIAGLVADHERKARYWKAALSHVDATLRPFSAEIDPDTIPPKRTYRQSRYFSGSELARFCMDELRKAEQPMPASAIYHAAVKADGVPDDPRTKTALVERILRFMREKQDAGLVAKIGISHDARWALRDDLPRLPFDGGPA
jgi:hypothetical protein